MGSFGQFCIHDDVSSDQTMHTMLLSSSTDLYIFQNSPWPRINYLMSVCPSGEYLSARYLLDCPLCCRFWHCEIMLEINWQQRNPHSCHQVRHPRKAGRAAMPPNKQETQPLANPVTTAKTFLAQNQLRLSVHLHRIVLRQRAILLLRDSLAPATLPVHQREGKSIPHSMRVQRIMADVQLQMRWTS